MKNVCTESRHYLFLSFLLLVILGFVIIAWSQSASAQTTRGWKQKWDKVRNEARKEGKVVVWGPPGELIRKAMTQGFKKSFPNITVEYWGSRGGQKAAKLKAERSGGIYSVDIALDGTTTANIYLKPAGALDPIEPALILPEVTELKHWRENRLEFSDSEGKYNLVFVNMILNPVVYNPKLVRVEEIDELYELLDPKWKGKIVINDPIPTGQGNIIFRWIWQVLGPKKATEYYRKIRAQAAAVDRDQRRQIEWVSRGKYAILLAGSNSVGQQLLKRGLKFSVLPEFKGHGAALSGSFGSLMRINKAPHPNATKVFINWLLSKDGQTAWSKAMNNVSRRRDVSVDHLPSYVLPKPGVKYWMSHLEKTMRPSPQEAKAFKEFFGR